MRKRKKPLMLILTLLLAAIMSVTAYASGTGSSETPSVTFTNVSDDQPDLFVKKTVTSALPGYTVPEGVEFTFVLKWDLDKDGVLETASNELYTLYDADETVISTSMRTGSDGSFTLTDGQTARFEYVGKNVSYEVTETNLAELNASGKYNGTFTQTTPAGGASAEGTVAADGTIVYFENSYIPDGGDSDTGELIIRKDISWSSAYAMPDDFDMGEFTFTVKIWSKPYANQAYQLYDTSTDKEIAATEDDYNAGKAIIAVDENNKEILDGSGNNIYVFATDGNGQFTMAAGQYAVFSDIEVPADYHVSEASDDDWYAIGEINDEGETSSLVYLYFTNEPTAFIVGKDMSDVNTDSDTGFTFKLTDAAGTNAMAGQSYYLYDSTGALVTEDAGGNEIKQPLATGTDGIFTLDAGQRALFYNIPLDTEYKVTEVVPDGAEYEVSPAEGYTGTVSENWETLSFVNTRKGSVTIEKNDQYGRNVEGVEFKIYKAEDCEIDGTTGLYFPKSDANPLDTQTTGVDGKLTFDNLSIGTYLIFETEVPDDYIPLEEPIEVTIPYTAGKAYIDANKISTEGAVYDEENSQYYFYNLSYTVTNQAILELPSTGTMRVPLITVSIIGCALAVAAAAVIRRRHREARIR